MGQASSGKTEVRSGHQLISAGAMVLISVVAWGFAAVPASACCTVVLCYFCEGSNAGCLGCGSRQPACNMAGCNCDNLCGRKTVEDFSCVLVTPCESSDARRQAQARFDEIDTSHDGKISPDEMETWLHKQKTSWLERIAKKSLPANLEATKANEKALLKWAFDQVDTDHDGFIEPAELDSSLGAPK